mgnify:CR=1 FL=1
MVIAVVFQLGSRYLPYGRRLFAIGSNPDAARVAGLPVQRDVPVPSSCPSAGRPRRLHVPGGSAINRRRRPRTRAHVVAAVVVGGVNIFGGAGSIIGAVLGAILIDLLQQSLIRWLEVSEFVRDAPSWAALILRGRVRTS